MRHSKVSGADADIERFLVALPSAQAGSEHAAELFLDQVLDKDAWISAARWEAVLRRFLVALPARQAPGVRLRAEVALAAELWRRSCPIAGRDGACVERIDKRAECFAQWAALPKVDHKPGRRPENRSPCGCYEISYFRYVVADRHPALAREAQQLLTESLKRARGMGLTAATPLTPVADSVAQALFLQAEPHFEQALARHLSAGAIAAARIRGGR